MEFVFVVPRRQLFPEAYPHGFESHGSEAAASVWEAIQRDGFFVERARAEVTPNWKQPIPYVVVAGPTGVLCVKRTKRGGEARLHDKLSIGIGGHVEPQDLPRGLSSGDDRSRIELVRRAALRELSEELELPESSPRDLVPVGLLNDDSNPVGAVHVGLVCVLWTQDVERVRVRERENLVGEVLPPDELARRQQDGANFETWSALLIPHLTALLGRRASAAGDGRTKDGALARL